MTTEKTASVKMTIDRVQDEESCAICFYAQKVDKELNQWRCRRNPPTIVPVTSPPDRFGVVQVSLNAAWTPIKGTDWCGEFEDDIEGPEDDEIN